MPPAPGATGCSRAPPGARRQGWRHGGSHLIVLVSHSSTETVEIGRRLGRRIRTGTVVALEGALGAGKTTLVKGIAEALAVREPVTSPTFTLISEYSAVIDGRSLPLLHVDLYRIARFEELEELGLDEVLAGAGVAVVEWSEKAAALLPEEAVRVRITIGPEGERTLEIAGMSL
jgi:tRNA threonylcarbamoyladenosine biosynthesis protein TsaE